MHLRCLAGVLLVMAAACRIREAPMRVADPIPEDPTAPPPAARIDESPRPEGPAPDAAPAEPKVEPEQTGMTMDASRPSDLEIVLTRKFAAPREQVFAALTQAEHTQHWMQASGMKLVKSELDLRPGGRLLHVFQRPSGRKIEVRGAIEEVEPPTRYSYVESYDFSPLRVHVTTTLEAAEDGTLLAQTMRYATKAERDVDYPGVAASSAEAFDRLERYLADPSK